MEKNSDSLLDSVSPGTCVGMGVGPVTVDMMIYEELTCGRMVCCCPIAGSISFRFEVAFCRYLSGLHVMLCINFYVKVKWMEAVELMIHASLLLYSTGNVSNFFIFDRIE